MIQKLIPAVFVLAAIALFFVYTNPTYTGPVKESETELQSFKNALKAAAQFKDKETVVEKQRNSISDYDAKRIEAFLPDGVNNVQLILDLTTLAANSGIQLSNFDVRSTESATAAPAAGAPSSATPSGPVGPATGAIPLQSTSSVDSLDFSVQASGTYNAFRTFLNAAEHSLRPLDLMSMSLKSGDKGVYTYTLTFRIYWLH
jgi:hypothetical protein